ncbi:MAG: hypothetical protein GWN13_09655, partial [Phycisphaerae bacterium]|nr:hypothetical protein [Phycisphaerae bacterium]
MNSFAVNKTRAYGHGEKVLEAMIQAGYLTVEDKFRAMEEGYSMGGTPWLRIYHGSFWHWIKEEVRRRIHGGDG